MKALFLLFHGFEEFNGISKKIRYQVKALKDCGLDVRTCWIDVASNGHRQWRVEDEVIEDLGSGTLAKVRKRLCYKAIARYVESQGIEFVYMRSFHNANPFTIGLVKRLHRAGARVVMEIPTYPYDQEYITPRMKMDLLVDRCFRRALAQAVDRIVTFSNEKQIFGARTICISNGIDFEAIAPRNHTNNTDQELHLIGVAEVHYWHGYDRLIKGLATYYAQPRTYKVYFHLVGELSGERERQEILPMVARHKLEPYVILHGARHGKELDALFERADFGIGSLGRHRSGITHIKTLKNREYAARGIPFVYSEMDEDFDDRPYVLKVPADESEIDMEQLIAFAQTQTMLPAEIRSSIAFLSWQEQMKRVIKSLYPQRYTDL